MKKRNNALLMMHQDLIQLGSHLRERRLSKNLSLKEVENGTSIRMNFLIAIEEGQVGKLISPLYAQGFIKRYAGFLDLDGENFLKEHPNALAILSEKPPETESFAYGLGSMEMRGSPAGEVKWLPNFLWVGGSVFFLLIAWFVARYFNLM